MIDFIKTIVQSVLALFVVIPTVVVLVILATNGNEWAACTLVGMAVAVLAYYGYKVQQRTSKAKMIRGIGYIPASDIETAYKKAFNVSCLDIIKRNVCFHISDAGYLPINTNELTTFLQEDKTEQEKYVAEYFDCDDVTFRLMGVLHMNRGMASQPFFITWVDTPEGGHSVLSFYIEGKIKIIEPQSDAISDVLQNWKPIMICG